MLNIALLGSPYFTNNNQVVRSDFGSAGRLLACFLFHFIGTPHRRERLIDLFWSDLSEERSRPALNTAIWRIRRMLELARPGGGRCLVTVQNEIILEPSSFIVVDTEALNSASRQTSAGFLALSEDDEAIATSAIAQYRAPFLDGEEGDWILHERERLHCLFVSTSCALMKTEARRGEFENALTYGRRILQADPFRERVQRDVMLLLAANGQRVDAIRAYESLCGLLKTELGIAPMPETVRLNDEIRSGKLFDALDAILFARFGTEALADALSEARCKVPPWGSTASPDAEELAGDQVVWAPS